MTQQGETCRCLHCGVDHFKQMLQALTGIFDYTGNDWQAVKNTAYMAIPNTECQSRPSTATAMRDACVATLRQIAADYDNVRQGNSGAVISKQAVLYAARQIESLTLDTVKQKDNG